MSGTRILWIQDSDDIRKLDRWLSMRPAWNKVVAIDHDDTGATSLCFFRGDYEAGLIRCANADLTDLTTSALADRNIEIVENTGGTWW